MGRTLYMAKKSEKVFAEYKDNLVIIDGENNKEREYLIPEKKIDRYDEKQIYLNISDDSLNEFEF